MSWSRAAGWEEEVSWGKGEPESVGCDPMRSLAVVTGVLGTILD